MLSKGTSVGAQQYTLEEIQALVEEAHRRGRKVAAHAHGTAGIKDAIRAGDGGAGCCQLPSLVRIGRCALQDVRLIVAGHRRGIGLAGIGGIGSRDILRPRQGRRGRLGFTHR